MNRYLLGLLCLSLPSAAQKPEQIVRQTYANLAYAVKLHTVFRIAMSHPKQVTEGDIENATAQTLKFQLSDFHTGPITEIVDKPYQDVVTKPDGSKSYLQIAVAGQSYSEPSPDDALKSVTTEGKWAHAQWAPEPPFPNSQMTVREMLAIVSSKSQFTTYTLYNVTASMNGQSRSYKAMFLFGPGAIEPIDGITRTLNQFESVVDDKIFLQPGLLRHNPAVKDWLKAHATAGHCDLDTLDCEPNSDDVQKALEQAAKPEAVPTSTQWRASEPPRADCDPNTCISKVLSLPDFSTAYELQEVVNTFRAIANFTNIAANPSDHTIAVKGTPEQLAFAEKLLSVLASLRSSGGHDRSSVFVYQLKGRLSGTAVAERDLAEHPERASTACELTSCDVKALYLPDLSMPELQNFINRVRTTTNMSKTMAIPSRHIVVIGGTPEQIALAERLSTTASAPQ